MALDLIGISFAFLVGYVAFWATALKLRKPLGMARPFVGYKYFGFSSYADLKSHVFGATALWAPIFGVGSVAMILSLGWNDSIWVFAFLIGYGLAIWRFWRRPRKSWEDENLPVFDRF